MPARLDAGPFRLQAALRAGAASDELAVYIEGDGASWRENLPPEDPTPRDPVALRLAARDPRAAVLWLGRPCQYLSPGERRGCPSKFWTTHRYAPDVERALAAAIERQRVRLGAARLHLIGYSGGGALAARLAARLPQAASLVTVAAPLDVGAWTRHHGVTTMETGLDGAALAGALSRLPQWHYAGADDRVVPPALVRAFVLQSGGKARFEAVAGVSHDCCWPGRWRALLDPVLSALRTESPQP